MGRAWDHFVRAVVTMLRVVLNEVGLYYNKCKVMQTRAACIGLMAAAWCTLSETDKSL